MKKEWFNVKISYGTIFIFWFLVALIFLYVIFYNPSLFNQMQQASYTQTPYVNTPLR